MLHEATNIDLDQYLGTWYEIASFPAWFSRGCSNTTANYALDGSLVRVTNTCSIRFTEPSKVARGNAKPSDKPNILKVGFPPFEFIRADYIIEFVDTTYSYAIVGSVGKLYSWILAREYDISQRIFEELLSIAKERGYPIEKFVRTTHCIECIG